MSQYTNYAASLPVTNDTLERVIEAINTFFKLDTYLITNDVHEVAITHRLGVYLDELFLDYNVDCEWNKNIKNSKKIFIPEIISGVKETISKFKDDDVFRNENGVFYEQFIGLRNLLRNEQTIKITDLTADELLIIEETFKNYERKVIVKSVRPDIIIHHRGTNNNHIVIEAKKKATTGKYLNAKSFDLVKLYLLTTQNSLEYKYGIYIELPEPDFVWSEIIINNSGFLNYLFGVKSNRVFEITFK